MKKYFDITKIKNYLKNLKMKQTKVKSGKSFIFSKFVLSLLRITPNYSSL